MEGAGIMRKGGLGHSLKGFAVKVMGEVGRSTHLN